MTERIGKRRIYVASSWRNQRQPGIVALLRAEGHEVYDFRNPSGEDYGFSWAWIDPNWEQWTPAEYLKALEHPLAKKGFRLDFEAMGWADTFVLVLPCGRSAHLELGWAVGAGRETFILLDNDSEPELMVKMVDRLVVNQDELVRALEGTQG